MTISHEHLKVHSNCLDSIPFKNPPRGIIIWINKPCDGKAHSVRTWNGFLILIFHQNGYEFTKNNKWTQITDPVISIDRRKVQDIFQFHLIIIIIKYSRDWFHHFDGEEFYIHYMCTKYSNEFWYWIVQRWIIFSVDIVILHKMKKKKH